MKKIVLLLVCLCLPFGLCGCDYLDNSQHDLSSNPLNDYVDKTESMDESISTNYQDSLLYSRLWSAWQYAADNNIPIYNFVERKEVCDFISVDNINQVAKNLIFIDEKQKIHLDRENSSHYSQSASESKLLYYGELNENSEPNGLGILFEVYTDFNDLDPELFVRYIGYFVDGEYEGYGVQFSTESLDDVLNASTLINWDILKQNLTLFNGNKTYEGYFKNGEYNGEGNYYVSNLFYLAINMDEVREISPNELTYSYIIGEFKNNESTSDSKTY